MDHSAKSAGAAPPAGDGRGTPGLENLAAGLAHEIRNPLGTILQAVDFLSRRDPGGNENPAQLAVLDALAEAARRINVVVTGLEQLATSEVDLARCALNPVVEQALTAQGELLAAQSVNVTADLDPSLTDLAVDAGLVRRMVESLVTEAGSAMDRLPEGSPRQLVVRTRPVPAPSGTGNAGATLEIEDTGCPMTGAGFDPGAGPFAPPRSDTALSTVDLAVAHRVMQLHRGTVRVENRSPNPGGVRVIAEFPPRGADLLETAR